MQFESLFQSAATSVAILRSDGTIIDVSDEWKVAARSSGFSLPNYAIGLNYLKYCVTDDFQSLRILQGLKKVLDRETGFFSTLYPCHSSHCRKWFIMAVFAVAADHDATAVMHIDVTHLYDEERWPSFAEAGVRDVNPNRLLAEIRRTVLEAVGSAAPRSDPQQPSVVDQRKLSKLTSRQREILGHLALGASNAEIAKSLQMTSATVKAQVAAALKKLELANRTQAALLANKLGLHPQK